MLTSGCILDNAFAMAKESSQDSDISSGVTMAYYTGYILVVKLTITQIIICVNH